MGENKIAILPIIILIFLSSGRYAFSQNEKSNDNHFKIMFYNVENLFDIFDDSLKNDNEFLPNSIRNWTWKRYNRKLQNISKVIVGVGGWRVPDIVGFCEVENYFVLKQLLTKTPLSNFDYRIIHYESGDNRGIDVALIYQPSKFKLLKSFPIKLSFSNDKSYKSRDILYAKGLSPANDTLHIFVNHWPSKFGGVVETIPLRVDAAKILKNVIDSIQHLDKSAKIIITGDFNDEPNDVSILSGLNALPKSKESGLFLYNLSHKFLRKWDTGTHKFKEKWSVLDQFIISSGLANSTSGLSLSSNPVEIVKMPFLIQQDKTYNGTKPNRTYIGIKYNGGYSDHLPILLNLKY